MNVQMLFSDRASRPGLRTGWGVSFLINQTVLFDTGESGPALCANMRRLRCDVMKIRHVFISHDHWDHTGGLWSLLKKNRRLTVYGCPGFSDSFQERVESHGARYCVVEPGALITRTLFSTGEMRGRYKKRPIPEHALILKTRNGVSLIAGCAHPGIDRVIDRVHLLFPQEPLHSIVGGFHLKDASKRKIMTTIQKVQSYSLRRIAPLHCTGASALSLFQQSFPKAFRLVAAGDTLRF